MTLKTIVVGALLVAAAPVTASEGLRVRVSPEMSYEPARIMVQVSVDPNRENRAMEIVAESGDYFRASQVQLDGQNASRTSVFHYHDLPAGEYEVRVTIFGQDGRERAKVRSTVMVMQ